MPPNRTECRLPRAEAAAACPIVGPRPENGEGCAPLPRGLRLRLTVAIPLVVTGLAIASGLLTLWICHPLFLEATRPVSAAELERRLMWAFATVAALACVAFLVSVLLAMSIARPLRELTSRVAALRPPTAEVALGKADATEIAALGSALEGVVSSVSDLILESYTLRSLESAVVTMDRAGVVTSFNAVAANVLGVPAGDAVGSRLTDVVPDEPTNERFQASLRRALAGAGRASSAEAAVRTRGGHTVQLGYSISPLRDEMGRSLGLVLTFKDLAEQKLAEQLLRRAENLAVLGSIASGLVHEIRTPLGAIRGYAEMIEDDLPPDSESRAYTRRIVVAVDRMDGLVRDLRTIGHPEPRAVEPHDLSALARDAVAFCRAGELGRDVEVREDYAAGLPSVPSDADQIAQALSNLLRNAFEAVEPGGRVAVRTWREDGAVAVAIHNTGSHIAPERQEKIFEPFHTTKRKGTGLGLAIAHQIVRAHGGRIAVASDPDAGTTFTVELPLVGPDVLHEV